MYAHEVLVIFISAVVAASLAAGALSGFVRSSISKAGSIADDVRGLVASDFEIVGVHAAGSEMNIYLKGIAGAADFLPAVFVDGVVASVKSSGFIRDVGEKNKLNAGDLAYITVSGSFADGKAHEIRVILPQAEAKIREVLG